MEEARPEKRHLQLGDMLVWPRNRNMQWGCRANMLEPGMLWASSTEQAWADLKIWFRLQSTTAWACTGASCFSQALLLVNDSQALSAAFQRSLVDSLSRDHAEAVQAQR